jgi:FkbM family methyltransferase
MKRILKYIRSIKFINYILRKGIRRYVNFSVKILNFSTDHITLSGTEKIYLPDGNSFKIFSRGDDFIPSQVFWKGYGGYEDSVEIFYHFAKRSKCIVDIGANIGYFSLVAAACNKEAKIIAFEPVERVYNRMIKQISINNFLNIVPEKKVVSDNTGKATLYVPNNNLMALAASVKKGWVTDVIPVESDCICLDDYKKTNNIKSIDLIKMDCEFHELSVLNGMKGILEKDGPTILIEILLPDIPGVKDYFEDNSYVEIEKMMRSYGYYSYLLYKGCLIKTDKLEYNPTDRNYLFVKYNAVNIFSTVSDFVKQYYYAG